MSIDSLKARAKRLRNAISLMLGQPISHAQSLELVAQEENYPTWDAACANYKPSMQIHKAPAHDGISPSSLIERSWPQVGRLIVGRPGTGKTFEATRIILEELRSRKPVIILDRGRSYFNLTETFCGRYHTTLDSEEEIACALKSANLLAIDFERTPWDSTWQVNIDRWIENIPKKEGLIVIDEAHSISTAFPQVLELLTSLTQRGWSYCITGQTEDDIQIFAEVPAPLIIMNRLQQIKISRIDDYKIDFEPRNNGHTLRFASARTGMAGFLETVDQQHVELLKD